MFLRNPWQHITKLEIASFYLSDTSLGDTGSIRIAVKFRLRDTPAYLLLLKMQKLIKRLVFEKDLIYFIKICFNLPQQHLKNEAISDVFSWS